MAVIINRGQRAYSLTDGPNGLKRTLEPGASLEVSAEEAKRMLQYNDIVDASDAVPQNAQEIERLKKENARLVAEQEKLRETAPAPKTVEKPPAKAPAPPPARVEKPEPKTAKKFEPMNKKKAKR
jgi:hypothetical protein